jgi:hypothetical protein
MNATVKTMTMKTIFVGVLLFCTAAPGWANDPSATGGRERGWFTGVGLGVIESEFDRGFAGTSTEYALFGGYRLNRFFAAEMAYLAGGKVERDGVELKTSSANLSVLASLPLGKRFSFFGRVGASAWQWEAVGVERNGIDYAYGAGAAVSIGRIELRLEGSASKWERDMNVSRAMLAGAWRF